MADEEAKIREPVERWRDVLVARSLPLSYACLLRTEDVLWLLARCRRLEAERNTARAKLIEIAESALPDHHAACTYCHCGRMDLCRDWGYVMELAALVPEQASALGYTRAVRGLPVPETNQESE